MTKYVQHDSWRRGRKSVVSSSLSYSLHFVARERERKKRREREGKDSVRREEEKERERTLEYEPFYFLHDLLSKRGPEIFRIFEQLRSLKRAAAVSSSLKSLLLFFHRFEEQSSFLFHFISFQE